MTQKLDLNRLRDVVIDSAARGNGKPSDPSKQVFVDKDANLILGDATRNPPRGATQIVNETFSGPAEEVFVREKMPRETRHLTTSEGIKGWLFPVTTDLGDHFQFFVFFNGASWQVMLVLPELEKLDIGIHEKHIFSEGRLCLSKKYGGGAPSLDVAFSRTVLWATGMSVARRTGKFPFNPE